MDFSDIIGKVKIFPLFWKAQSSIGDLTFLKEILFIWGAMVMV
jgi:hypothetical protein